jgi:hypothetical protein
MFDIMSFKSICLEKNCFLKFQENLQIKTGATILTLRLLGVGIQPSIGLSIEGNTLNFGYCLAGEKIEQVIQV